MATAAKCACAVFGLALLGGWALARKTGAPVPEGAAPAKHGATVFFLFFGYAVSAFCWVVEAKRGLFGPHAPDPEEHAAKQGAQSRWMALWILLHGAAFPLIPKLAPLLHRGF